MPVSRNAAINTALRDRLHAFAEAGGYRVAYEGWTFPASGNTDDLPPLYLSESFVPNETRERTVGAGPQVKRGLYQVSVHTNSREGFAAAKALADGLVDHFAAQRVLYSGSVQVRITSEPYWSGPIADGAWTRFPVTIPYQCCN